MYIGKTYRLSAFLYWTRRSILRLSIIGTLAALLYEAVGLKWVLVPWPVVALLGTATAFIVGFKNVQTYNRTWEARQIWGGVMSASRTWALMCRDFIIDRERAREMIYRHLAWLTALRYQLRSERAWETVDQSHNSEYQRHYSIPERQTPLEAELIKYIGSDEINNALSKHNKAIHLLSLQGEELASLYAQGKLDNYRFMSMHAALQELTSHQGNSERIKNFPYPRQYATINALFVNLFTFLLPFALLKEFDGLNEQVTGIWKGQMVWLVIPFSVLLSWIYTSLDQVGESTENPFEGSSNDVPISQMSRAAEIDIREMLGEQDLPMELEVRNSIIL